MRTTGFLLSSLRYFEPRGATEKNISLRDGLETSDGIGLGRPADFDGDGTARIPMVDDSDRLVLVNSDGDETVLVDSGVDKSPVAAVDWDEDGELEVMYLDGGKSEIRRRCHREPNSEGYRNQQAQEEDRRHVTRPARTRGRVAVARETPVNKLYPLRSGTTGRNGQAGGCGSLFDN